MKIDHVAMYVNDLEAEKNFFVKYFNATAGSKYTNFRNDFSNYFLSFADGSRLEIMTRSSSADPKKDRYQKCKNPYSIQDCKANSEKLSPQICPIDCLIQNQYFTAGQKSSTRQALIPPSFCFQMAHIPASTAILLAKMPGLVLCARQDSWRSTPQK